MCDTSSIMGDVFGKVNIPFPETRKTVDGYLNKAGPIISAGLKSYSAISTSKAAEKQAGVRMAQINYGADVQMKQTEQMQERILGANRAAFAKSGVKATGSAKRLLEEQIKQDEIELLKIRHERNVNITNEQKTAKMAQLEARNKAAKAFGSKEVYGSVTDIFGLG